MPIFFVESSRARLPVVIHGRHEYQRNTKWSRRDTKPRAVGQPRKNMIAAWASIDQLRHGGPLDFYGARSPNKKQQHRFKAAFPGTQGGNNPEDKNPATD